MKKVPDSLGGIVCSFMFAVLIAVANAEDKRTISFAEFLKVGLPVTYLTLTVGFLWLLFRFVVLGS